MSKVFQSAQPRGAAVIRGGIARLSRHVCPALRIGHPQSYVPSS